MTTVRVAVPRKGRPLEAVLSRFADAADAPDRAEVVIETLRHEKAVTKGQHDPHHSVYDRLAEYSDPADPLAPEYTLLRDAREGMPRRVVFDSCGFELDDHTVQLVGREEPFRALRKHEFALGFDSADLVLEEVVELRGEPLSSLEDVNERIDPRDTDVRVVSGLGDTVHHTLLSNEGVLTREAIAAYAGPLCISPRYERLVEAVVGSDALDGVEFCYPNGDEEEAAIAEIGVGVYLTVTGSTAREYGLDLGERLFPSETVLLANGDETTAAAEAVADTLFETPLPA
ncbi:hypothetical protein [Natronomonas sp. EA1]|uniref:hypothetical protein n=1 Tax=Natronomonas sp. EA1 TaxID=3421655 RepID=UPI003EBA0C9F